AEPYALNRLASGLAWLSMRLGAGDAAGLNGQAAVLLARAITKTTNGGDVGVMVQPLALWPESAPVEAKAAGEAAELLLQAMNKATEPYTLNQLATGLAWVARRLEAKRAAAVSSQAAALLTQAMSKAADANGLAQTAQ